MRRMLKSYEKNEYISFSMWFLLSMAVILLLFAMRYKSLIVYGDGLNQYFPVFVYIGQWLRACLHGEARLFDFRLGLGDDVIYALNYYGFGDITQLISAAFPYKYAEYAYGFVMVLKLWLSGISFLIYIKRYVHNEKYRVVGALLYACNTYTLVWGSGFWMFIAPMMTFPLILSGIDAVCAGEKRLSGTLLAGLWIQALNGFYFLYMETLMAILYFGVMEFASLRKTGSEGRIKRAFSDGLKIGGQALLAVGLGAPLLIPSIASYLQSPRTDREKIVSGVRDILVYSFDRYRAVLSHLLVSNIYRNILTLGYIVVLGIFIGCIYRSERNRVHRYMLVLLTILYCIPLWGSVMNGFSSTTDRWLFGYLLIAITMAMIGIDSEIILSKKEIAVFYLLSLMLIVLYFTDSDWYAGKVLSAAGYGVVGIVLPFFCNQRVRHSKWIVPFCAALVIADGLLVLVPREIGGSGYIGGFMARGETIREVDLQIDAIKGTDRPFERWDVVGASLGASLMKDYYGTTEYFSTLNRYASEFYQELYISPGIFGAKWILKGLDERTELQALLSVGQEAYLPLGATYGSWISREHFDNLNPMEKEAALIRYAVLEKGAEAVSVQKSDKIDPDILEGNDEIAYSLEMQNIIQDGKYLYAQEDAGIRVYPEDFDAADELYVQLENMFLYDEGRADVAVGNKEIQLRNVDDGYYMGVDEFWVHVTELQSDDKRSYFDIRLPDNQTFSLEKLNVYQHQINYAAIEERKGNSLEQTEIGINRISGKVNCEDASLMVFSIPYGKGWSAYVDGIKQPVYRADVGFFAIELDEGEHEVVLKYITPGLLPGCICAVISVLVLTGIWLRRERDSI